MLRIPHFIIFSHIGGAEYDEAVVVMQVKERKEVINE
jgi:hypothetical protein